MPPFSENVVRAFFEQATARSARSTALHPLQWILGLILSALALSALAKGPEWLLISLFVLAAIDVALIIFAYLFLLFRDRDALRSESFNLSKLAIEKGMAGDDLVGLHNPDLIDAKALPSADTAPEGLNNG